MSRAINVNAAPSEVAAMCSRHAVTISAMEQLKSGGTRVVLMNATDTATIAKAFSKKILVGPVTRTPMSTWAR